MEKELRYPLSTPPLFLAYLKEYNALAHFYRWAPLGDYQPLMGELSQHSYNRKELAGILQNQACRAVLSLQKDKIDQWIDGQGMVVVTGQQPGLFGGPLFNIYKALTALRLAQEVEAKYGRPCLALFWVVAEDHDLHEMDRLAILDKGGRLKELLWRPQEKTDYLPACAIPLDDNLQDAREKLGQELTDLPYASDVLQGLASCYESGLSLSWAFIRWLGKILSPFGLVMVDPSDSQLKKAAAPVFEKELASPSTSLVARAGRELEERGFRPSIKTRAQDINLFYLEGRRYKMVEKEGMIDLGKAGKRLSRQEAVSLAREDPQRFSSNVVTFPIMQSFLFPVVAAVAGPGEVSYYAQLKEVYAHFGLPMPVIFTRKSFTLVPEEIARLLKKESLQPLELAQGAAPLLARLARERLPEELARALADLKQGLEEGWLNLEDKVARWDPSLLPSLETSRSAINFRLTRLEEKLIKAKKRQEDTTAYRITRAGEALFPAGQPQERVLAWCYFLARYGPGLLDRIMTEVELFDFAHKFIYF